jgi:hypothetical protein
MYEQRIEIQEGQSLTLDKLLGNASIAAWDEADVLVKLPRGEERDLIIEQGEGGPSASARQTCEVRVPAGLALKVREAKGNLAVKGISSLDAEQVRGRLKLGDVGEAKLAEVYGGLSAKGLKSVSVAGTVFGSAGLKNVERADLQNVRGSLTAKVVGRLHGSRIGGNVTAKEVEGSLNIDQVGGNATLKDVGAEVRIGQVAGNLTGKNLTGGAKVPKIGGNLVLGGEIGQGRSYQFCARGNAVLGLREDASAHLTMTAAKFIISTPLTGEVREGRTLSGSLGDGGAEIAIEVRGNVVLGSKDAAQTEMGAEFAGEVARQLEEGLAAIDFDAIGQTVGAEMDEAMSRLQVKLESVDWDRVGARTQQAVDRAMDRMQRDMERMVAKAERHQVRLERNLERQKRRMERKARKLEKEEARGAGIEIVVEGDSAEDAYEEHEAEPGPNLDEERLSILRMLEQGQIAPEEAEMLLDALL